MATLRALGRSDYRQHNPAFEDGLEGICKVAASRAPRPPPRFLKVVAEGDTVITLRRVPPQPDAPTGAEERAIVDIFRLDEAGKVAEHWDFIETFPRGAEPPKNQNGRF
mgnify:CR=1 FL=1